jgi:hypothetical protein
MEIFEGLEIVDLCLKYKDMLILGDLQLGYEEYLNRGGIMVPRFQTNDVIERIEKILGENKDIRKILFNGDIKHEFGRISRQEWDAVERLLDKLIEKYEILMIKGNHDVLLEPILKKYEKIKLVDSYSVDNLFILHGDKISPDVAEVIIIGHEHPAVSFEEKPGEKFKCFLKGKWRDHALIVMPSFNMLNEGTDLTKEKNLSPYLNQSLDDFEIYLVEDKTYYFGKLKKIKKG